MRTEDIARFGLLYLNHGSWNGQQLVPKSWVEAATRLQTSNGSNPDSDWERGYGYQFWRCRHGAYRGDGAFGQFCIVMPDQDAVIAITSGLKDMQGVLNLVWDKLLPSMTATPLPANEAAATKLKSVLASQTIPAVAGSHTPPKSAEKTFSFAANPRKLETIKLLHDEAGDQYITIRISMAGKVQEIRCGNGRWIKDQIAFGSLREQPAAASGAWSGDDTFTAKICFYETPFIVTLALKYGDDKVVFTSQANVGMGPARAESLTGVPSAQ